jgi:hypothetical protein
VIITRHDESNRLRTLKSGSHEERMNQRKTGTDETVLPKSMRVGPHHTAGSNHLHLQHLPFPPKRPHLNTLRELVPGLLCLKKPCPRTTRAKDHRKRKIGKPTGSNHLHLHLQHLPLAPKRPNLNTLRGLIPHLHPKKPRPRTTRAKDHRKRKIGKPTGSNHLHLHLHLLHLPLAPKRPNLNTLRGLVPHLHPKKPHLRTTRAKDHRKHKIGKKIGSNHLYLHHLPLLLLK